MGKVLPAASGMDILKFGTMACLVLPRSIRARHCWAISLAKRLKTLQSAVTHDDLNSLSVKSLQALCLLLNPSSASFAALTLSPNASIFFLPLTVSPILAEQARDNRQSKIAAENSGPVSSEMVASQEEDCLSPSSQLQQGLASWS